MTWVDIFFSAKGRVRRGDFWVAWLLLAIASGVLGLFGTLGELALILFIYPQICLFSKRLHDLGRSGWFTALLYGLGLFGSTVAAVVEPLQEAGSGGPVVLVGTVVVVVSTIAAVVLFFRTGLARGESQANRFGAPPTGFFRRGVAGEAA